MSSNGLTVTVVGWAASTPREVIGDGVPFTSFRVATTPRYFDNRQGAWADGRTEWITVKVFRDVAFNVASSVHKGEPVVAHGRLRTEDWISENGPRTGLVLEASALGHDLSRGTAKFARTVYASGAQDGGSQDGGSQDGGSQDGGSQDGGSQDGGAQDGADDDADLEPGSGGGEAGDAGVTAAQDPWATAPPAGVRTGRGRREPADEEAALATP